MPSIDDFPTGSRCFVDANVLAYALSNARDYSEPSRRFVQRIESGEIEAATSLGVICDAIHATMLAEAMLRFGLEGIGVRRYLQRNYWRMKELTTFAKAAQSLLESRVEQLSVEAADVVRATQLAQSYGLLTNDAIIAALIERHGIAHLATNDDDFTRVPGITIWQPRAAAS